jgi:transposase
MPRKYTNIKQYESQLVELKGSGKTNREIAQTLGLELSQVKNWISRFNHEQRKIEAGIKLRPKGRPRKDGKLRDIVAEQSYEIERLKMENKLLRDFMQLAGRK